MLTDFESLTDAHALRSPQIIAHIARPPYSPAGTTMTRPILIFACGLDDRIVPRYTGELKAEGLDLDFIVIDGPPRISLD